MNAGNTTGIKRAKSNDCQDEQCDRKGFWTEPAGGELLFCFNVKHHGQTHVQKLSLKEIEAALSKDEL